MVVVLDAVLFDWGDTLMPYEGVTDEAFALARTQAGLRALARDDAPDAVAIGEWFRARVFDRDGEDEEDYQAFTQMDVLNVVRRLLEAR